MTSAIRSRFPRRAENSQSPCPAEPKRPIDNADALKKLIAKARFPCHYWPTRMSMLNTPLMRSPKVCRVHPCVEVCSLYGTRIDNRCDRLKISKMIRLVETEPVEEKQHFIVFAAAHVALGGNTATRRAGEALREPHNFLAD